MVRSLTDAQAKQVIDAEQAFAAYLDAQEKARSFAGGMHWKTVASKQYLYKTSDGSGRAKSLGVRSSETEALAEAFHSGKERHADRLKALRETLVTQQRVNAALRVGSAPGIVADICLALSSANWLGRNLLVIDTNALYAYEAMAGVRFDKDITATTDMDLLWHHTVKLGQTPPGRSDDEDLSMGLMGLLQRVDKSFEILQLQPYRAANDKGFLVDLIRQMPEPPWKNEPDRMAEDDLIATDIWNMKWLLNAPKISQTCIAIDGRMFNLLVPDPRAFAMFKHWLSQSDERNPVKKGRDAAQARAVTMLLKDRLPISTKIGRNGVSGHRWSLEWLSAIAKIGPSCAAKFRRHQPFRATCKSSGGAWPHQ